MRVAIVHDYLTQRGGGERVVLEMAAAFPDAPVYTSLYASDLTFPEFKNLDVRPILPNVAALRNRHRWAFPYLAQGFSRFHVEADVALVHSSGWAHGASTSGRKVVYCSNPARWLYQADEYFGESAGVLRRGLSPVFSRLRSWDQAAAASADKYLTNSETVARRIDRHYGISAEVLHPPAGLSKNGETSCPESLPSGPFVLVVSRLMKHKNVDVAIEAINSIPGVSAVVVGDGPERSAIDARFSGRVCLLRSVSDSELRWLYREAVAVMAASHEDYGLVPVEAAQFGTPVVALRKAGFRETVREGVSGEFFDEPSAPLAADALHRALARTWDSDRIQEHATNFSAQRFRDQLQRSVEQAIRT